MFSSKEKIQKSKVMERNVVAKNTSIVGDVISEGDFRIDGSLEGTIITQGRVIIGVEGSIKGKVESTNADIEGRFSGELIVQKTLAMKSSAHITGEVVVGKLSVEPGATFNATCSMKGTIKELNQNEQQKKRSEKTA
ncbi:MAG: polymer-forming cytoskeletal protein [Flavobacteriaceae bacterium]|nr:polymer-forming cytoskeletal protein [Flavobacteriaceae bacterium]